MAFRFTFLKRKKLVNSLSLISSGTSGGASGDGSGGIVAAGGSSSSVKNITISGNSISKINYANKHNNQAAIQVHYCVGVTVTGNAIEDTYGVGIRLQQNCVHVLVSDNHIKNILAKFTFVD